MGTKWLGKGWPRAKTAAKCSVTVRKTFPLASPVATAGIGTAGTGTAGTDSAAGAAALICTSGPVFCAVGVFLMFPDRHGGLDPVNEFFQYRKRFGAVRGRNCDEKRHITDLEITNSVGNSQPMHARAVRELPGNLLQNFLGTGVGGIAQRRHVLAAVVIAHRTHERGNGPGLGIRNQGHHLRDINRSGTYLRKPQIGRASCRERV